MIVSDRKLLCYLVLVLETAKRLLISAFLFAHFSKHTYCYISAYL